MNKTEVNEMLPRAYDLLKKYDIVEKNKIKKSWYGQISTFGSAISTGSLLPAIASFSDKGSCSVERGKLLLVIRELICKDDKLDSSLYEYVNNKNKNNMDIIAKDSVLNATIAVKLAMKLYELSDEKAQ